MNFQGTRRRRYVSTHYPPVLPPPSLTTSRPGPSIFIDGRSEGSSTAYNYALHSTGKDICGQSRQKRITINVLPDDVLLETFNFYVMKVFRPCEKHNIDKWTTLAHVCRRWRSVVFQSPIRLSLRLLCTPKTPARNILDIWPPLPLIVYGSYDLLDRRNGTSGLDNITAALDHNDRVCQIALGCLTRSALEHVTDSAAMQKPFPELTHLRLKTYNGPEPTLPDSFLGGTAPRLQSLYLDNVTFHGLPKLLLSTHLVHLDLRFIPRSGYIQPETMATSLSALTNLASLRLEFRYPRRCPALESRRPPPLTRSIIPSLTQIIFKGTSEYLEEILARIDAPQVNELYTTFFNQIIFDTPQLFQFISRRPSLRAPDIGHVAFNSGSIIVGFSSQTSDHCVLSVEIRCRAPEWQLSSLEQVCISSLPPVSTLEDLYIFEPLFEDQGNPPLWQDDVENMLWLDLLRPFAAVKNLYLSKELAPRVAPALQELVGGRQTEFLPILENIFLEKTHWWKPLDEGIERFIASRRPPVALSRWSRPPEMGICEL